MGRIYSTLFAVALAGGFAWAQEVPGKVGNDYLLNVDEATRLERTQELLQVCETHSSNRHSDRCVTACERALEGRSAFRSGACIQTHNIMINDLASANAVSDVATISSEEDNNSDEPRPASAVDPRPVQQSVLPERVSRSYLRNADAAEYETLASDLIAVCEAYPGAPTSERCVNACTGAIASQNAGASMRCVNAYNTVVSYAAREAS